MKELSAIYESMEADYYDQFAGKSGISFYTDLLERDELAQHVLEVGVGTGRIAIEISRKGIPVTGIDNSGDMLKFAKKKRRLYLEIALLYLMSLKWMLCSWISPKPFHIFSCLTDSSSILQQ